MGTIEALLGFMTALPKLLEMISGFWKWVNAVSGNDPAGFLVRSGQVISQLSEAKTQDDHKKAAKALSDLIASLPRR